MRESRRQRPGSGSAWPLGQAGPSPRPAAGRGVYSGPERQELLAGWEASGLTTNGPNEAARWRITRCVQLLFIPR